MIIYTKEQIEDIEKAVHTLWSYADQHKRAPLSRCYQCCEIILKNIKICRDDNWNSIEELSKYIKEDWGEAIKRHVGQYSDNFYIPGYGYHDKINDPTDELVNECNTCINKTYKHKDDIFPTVYKCKEYYVPAGIQPDILNDVYRKALEWGKNWRRPIYNIVEDVANEINEAEKQELVDYIKAVRADIEDYIYFRYQEFELEIDYKGLYAWIQNKYPWIDNENLKHAVSQGIYYAMK